MYLYMYMKTVHILYFHASFVCQFFNRTEKSQKPIRLILTYLGQCLRHMY